MATSEDVTPGMYGKLGRFILGVAIVNLLAAIGVGFPSSVMFFVVGVSLLFFAAVLLNEEYRVVTFE